MICLKENDTFELASQKSRFQVVRLWEELEGRPPLEPYLCHQEIKYGL